MIIMDTEFNQQCDEYSSAGVSNRGNSQNSPARKVLPSMVFVLEDKHSEREGNRFSPPPSLRVFSSVRESMKIRAR